MFIPKLRLLFCCLFLMGWTYPVIAEQDTELPDCKTAMTGTIAHYTHGDASEAGYDVDCLQGATSCTVTNDWCDGNSCSGSPLPISCYFDVDNCPDPSPAGVDGHHIPDTVECEGCDGALPQTFSMSEALCCLMYGSPVDPSTGLSACW